MSVNLSFFTDLHLRGQGPSSRKDDYPVSILSKLQYCLEYSSKNSDIALFGGDFCHSHKLVSDSVKERAIELFDENLKVPFIYTWGQHDLNGKDYETRHESTKAFILRQALRKANKTINEIPTDKDLIIESQGVKIGLIACPQGFDCFKWAKRISRRRNKEIDVRIALIHHLITTDDDKWFLLNYKDFETGTGKNRGFDVVLCGDLHQGFVPKTNDAGTLFINPGALARTQKSSSDVARPIRAVDVIIDSETKSVDYDFWPIMCAGTSEEVFKKDAPIVDDMERIEDSKKEEPMGFEDVISALKSISASKIDIWDMLEMKAKEESLEEDVLRVVLSKRPDA